MLDWFVPSAFITAMVIVAIWVLIYERIQKRRTQKIWDDIRRQRVTWAETHNINPKDLK